MKHLAENVYNIYNIIGQCAACLTAAAPANIIFLAEAEQERNMETEIEISSTDIFYPETDLNNDELIQWFLLACLCKGDLSRSEINKLLKLNEKHFTEENQKLYKAIQEQYKKSGKIDRVLLAEQVGKEYETVKQVTTNTGAHGKAVDYAKALITRHTNSRIAEICDNFAMQEHKNPAKLSEEIRKANEECKQELAIFENTAVFDNVSEYIRSPHGLAADVQEFKKNSGIKTGFNDLDNKTSGGLHAGLYVLGAASSLGKTTFTHQIADQLARQGNKVLFFSMEQSRLELISKSIARRLAIKYKADPERCQTSFFIRKYMFENAFIGGEISEYIQDTAENMHIIEGNFDTTADYIKNYVSDFIEAHDGIKPIVFIDYLQIIQAPADKKKLTTKEATDYNITELKRLSRRFNVPVIVISSVNRQNYLSQIDFESFKESGGVEYGADVALGLQLDVIHDKIFDNSDTSNKNGKRTKLQEAKKEIPRKIELVGLKNRFGICNFSCNFLYFPQYDLFVEDKDKANKTVKPTKKPI